MAAFTTLVSYLVSFVILSTKIKNYLEIIYDVKVIAKCGLASVVMGIVLYWLNYFLGDALGGLLLSIVVGILMYSMLLYVLRTFSTKEINYVRSFVLAKNGNF